MAAVNPWAEFGIPSRVTFLSHRSAIGLWQTAAPSRNRSAIASGGRSVGLPVPGAAKKNAEIAPFLFRQIGL
jgi:hypothetical protein